MWKNGNNWIPNNVSHQENYLLELPINYNIQICLLSPNVVYFIHKNWFKWKDKNYKL